MINSFDTPLTMLKMYLRVEYPAKCLMWCAAHNRSGFIFSNHSVCYAIDINIPYVLTVDRQQACDMK